ncbi:PEPxxWA-CTERM sorting domain-containing protein [Phenylobacterium sp. Root700]|uniref:PEPxxWA-CTERM sorting domain-containing protein n=1 Tax=Phenylobacterium sp. Root700 TaxID=1736591 RepID=UPI0009EB558B|nr:PEPxxWA-CTERM sorting domain-containing protein [Phenylobacterium sp. Root700]
MQFASNGTANRALFGLLLLTVTFPLPAMTPALLSDAVGAMALVSTVSRAEAARSVPIYFIPVRPGAPKRPIAMVDDAVLDGIVDPTSIIYEAREESPGSFDQIRPMPVVAEFAVRPPLWRQLIAPPTAGGSGNTFPSAVPEPATWAMLTGGFMLAGALLRRRRDSRSNCANRSARQNETAPRPLSS